MEVPFLSSVVNESLVVVVVVVVVVVLVVVARVACFY